MTSQEKESSPEKEESPEIKEEQKSPPTLRRGSPNRGGSVGFRGTPSFRVSTRRAPLQRLRTRFTRRGLSRRRFPITRRRNRFFQNRNFRNFSSFSNSGKLFVSGFGFLLSNFELNRIFSPFGKLSRCKIHYDNLGRSRGTANVDFIYPQDARKAILSMNGAKVGRFVMRVKYDGSNSYNLFRRRGRNTFGFRRFYFGRR